MCLIITGNIHLRVANLCYLSPVNILKLVPGQHWSIVIGQLVDSDRIRIGVVLFLYMSGNFVQWCEPNVISLQQAFEPLLYLPPARQAPG